jgi:hypothetical protein
MKSALVLCLLIATIGCEKKDGETTPPDDGLGTTDTGPKVQLDNSVPQEPDPPEIAQAEQQYLMGEYAIAIEKLQPVYTDLKKRNQYRASALAGTWLALAHAELVFENGKEPAEWAAQMAQGTDDPDVDAAAKLAMGAYLIGNEEFDKAATELDGAATAKAQDLLVMAQLLRAEALIGAAFGGGEEDSMKDPAKLEAAKLAYDAAATASKGHFAEPLVRGRIEEGYAALADYKKQKEEVCAHAGAAFEAFKNQGATRLLEGPAKLATANKCAIPGAADVAP